MKINPGAIRVTSPLRDGNFLSGYDVVIEVQKEDGSWLRLSSAVDLTINVKPDSLPVVTVGLLTSEIDLELIAPEQVAFIRAKLPGVASVTEHDARLRERKAYENGIVRGHAREFATLEQPLAGVRTAVDEVFPMPDERAS